MTTIQDLLAGLAAQLTESQDRATYAALISYLDSLPPGDELFRLAQLLGFLSLFGQRIPAAVNQLLAELQEQTKTAADYHARMGERLTRLPAEIAAGVETDAMAKAMSESFRQQLAASGLEQTATLLRSSLKEIKALSSEIPAALKPVIQEYRGVSTAISRELATLATASGRLRQHNAELVFEERSSTWVKQGLAALLLFLIGGICGMTFEKRQPAFVDRDVGTRIEGTQTPEKQTRRSALSRKEERHGE
ncbi:MAG TPA: hypothetical protein VK604_04015 [Bryobacteraceae bacterium]|nr:hypothetical protein [Bryobacteraceae bacterium]